MFFLTCSWRFLISNKLEQLEFKLEQIIGFRNMQEKSEKNGLHVFRISKQYSLNKVDLHGKSSEGKELVGKGRARALFFTAKISNPFY